jgi:hypothetical protein
MLPALHQVLRWALDFTLGTITIVFPEPVVPPVLLTSITLQSTFQRSSGYYYTLTGGTYTLSADQTTLTVYMSAADKHAIKSTPTLCRVQATSLMTLASTLTADTSGNAVVPIIDGNALGCATFTPNTIPPVRETSR